MGAFDFCGRKKHHDYRVKFGADDLSWQIIVEDVILDVDALGH